MSLEISCVSVDVNKGFGGAMLLTVYGPDLAMLDISEVYDYIDVDKFIQHHGLELKEDES